MVVGGCLDRRNFVIIFQTPLSMSSVCDQVVKDWAIFVHTSWISARFNLTPCGSSRFLHRKKYHSGEPAVSSVLLSIAGPKRYHAMYAK